MTPTTSSMSPIAGALPPEPVGDGLTHGARIRAIMAGSAGNLIEWFDFYVYAFTSIYFAASFFPAGDQTARLLNVAGIYAAGFLVRPLGGWFFGRYSDRHGRRAGMVLSVTMMGAAAFAIAILPTYAQVGQLAPALLLVLRLVQGFSTGGQYGAAATYLSEIATPRNRGFYASFHFVTLIGGQLLALLVLLALQSLLGGDAIRAWGWRIPFVIGALLSLTLLLLRDHMHEPVATGEKPKDAGSIRGLLRYPRSLLIVVLIAAGGGVALYSFTTYMQKFLVNTAGMTVDRASIVVTAAMVVFMVLQPIIGSLSDRIGRRTCLLVFGGGMTLAAVPLFTALGHTISPLTSFFLLAAALAILSFYTSVSGLFKAELFPPHVRALGVGLAHSVSTAVFGGTAELIALMFKRAGYESGFYWYVTGIVGVAFLTALVMREPRRADMMAHDTVANGEIG